MLFVVSSYRGRPRKTAATETCSSSSDAIATKKPKKETSGGKLLPETGKTSGGKRGPKKRQKLKRFVDEDENANDDACPFDENSETSEEDHDEEMKGDQVMTPDPQKLGPGLTHRKWVDLPEIDARKGWWYSNRQIT